VNPPLTILALAVAATFTSAALAQQSQAQPSQSEQSQPQQSQSQQSQPAQSRQSESPQSQAPSAQDVPAGAQTTPTSPVYGGESVTMTGTIESVDRETRTITIKGRDARTISIRFDESMPNLERLQKGSKVTARYSEAMLLSIARGDAPPSPQVDTQSTQQAPAGGEPAMQSVKQSSVVAKVTNIDTATNRITMQAPNGEELQLRVRDPQVVSSLKTGDRVIASYVEAFALSVDREGDQPAGAAERVPQDGTGDQGGATQGGTR
jgi:hypothetical protein